MPVKEISNFPKLFKDILLMMPRFKGVQAIEGDKDHKRVYLINRTDELLKFAEENKYQINDEEISIGYDHMNMSKIIL